MTLDAFRPDKPNGCAILFMVSGGFFSSHDAINPDFYRALLDRGYTVFAVVHGSQPRFFIPEIEQDIHRAVRFVRHNAAQFEINPDKLGITGASAGGHLSLTMATQGRPGNADAKASVSLDIDGLGNPDKPSQSLLIIVLITLLSVAPALLIVCLPTTLRPSAVSALSRSRTWRCLAI